MAKGPTKRGKLWRTQPSKGPGINRMITKRQEVINSYLRKANGMDAVSPLLAALMDRAGLILEVPVQEVQEEAVAVAV